MKRAAQTQTQAANLKTQQAHLENKQQTANQQQKQADQLKKQLTQELTKAGGDERGTDPRLVKIQDGISGTSGVQVVSPPNINKSGDAVVFTAVPTNDPAAPATANLVKELRSYVLPRAIAGQKGVHAFVGGSTASYVDLASGIRSRLLLVILTVVLLSFIVLLTAYRSLIDQLGLTQAELAGRLGEDRSSVANFLRLLDCVER